jgi:hypothetical protein
MHTYTYMYIYVCMYMYIYVCVYVYVYNEFLAILINPISNTVSLSYLWIYYMWFWPSKVENINK